MDKNLDLTIGFKGQLKVNAVAMPLQEGYLKIGGIAGGDAALPFGVVCSADPADMNAFVAGVPTGNIVRGIAVYDDAIAENSPAHPNSYLAGMPCAALNHGFLWLENWGKTATGAIDPVVGAVVIYNNTTGAIEFLASRGSAPTGWTALANASVREISGDNGALVYLD